MTYKTQAYSALFGFPIDLDTDAKLVDAISTRAIIDFGDYNDRGSGTIIGKLHCNEDGSYTFEGLTGLQQFPVGENVDRLIAHWPGFTKAQEDRHEADKVRWWTPKEA
jgi:hypothetical protein